MDRMSDPTPAEIEAGAAACAQLVRDYPRAVVPWHTLVSAVLSAVLDDHDARVRRATIQWAAREVRDRLGAVAAHRQLSYQDGASDAARLLDNLATDARLRAEVAEETAQAIEVQP